MSYSVYLKEPGEPSVPVTVRIRWLPDGKINPLMYWTPDNSCYEVKKVYERISLSLLNERGAGLRFRIRAVIEGGAEQYTDNHFIAQHETYLYLADSFFSGKNFIDDRYEHDAKEYIPVTMDVFEDCDYELISFKVKGIEYDVKKTLDIKPKGSFYAGGIGIWHKVEAEAQQADTDCFTPHEVITRGIFFEINKWYASISKAS